MKKFFTTFFILLILAGAGFFFGWAQIGIPPGSCGVIRSKTHGTDPHLVKSGEFRWVWYKLIPTNAKTIVFRLSPVVREFSAKDTLPSGKVYSSFAGLDGEFSWEINAAFSFSIAPEALIPLVSANNVGSQEELELYENDIAGQIQAFIQRRMDSSEEFVSQIEALLVNDESPALEQEISRQFPQIAGFSIVIKSAKLPDFALYRAAKGLFEEYIAMQKEYIAVDLREKAKNQVESQSRFDELELYGALLSKYPILLDFLSLEKNKN